MLIYYYVIYIQSYTDSGRKLCTLQPVQWFGSLVWFELQFAESKQSTEPEPNCPWTMPEPNQTRTEPWSGSRFRTSSNWFGSDPQHPYPYQLWDHPADLVTEGPAQWLSPSLLAPKGLSVSGGTGCYRVSAYVSISAHSTKSQRRIAICSPHHRPTQCSWSCQDILENRFETCIPPHTHCRGGQT